MNMTEHTQALRGWESSFNKFCATDRKQIIAQLCSMGFLQPVSDSQRTAWRNSIPQLQNEMRQVIDLDLNVKAHSAILEYQLPLELRRPDTILLLHDAVVVIEFKGYGHTTFADIDQVKAYARDLANYHEACHDRQVIPILVPLRKEDEPTCVDGVRVCSIKDLVRVLAQIKLGNFKPAPSREVFLHEDSYRPLPSLLTAARELFEDREKMRLVHKAAANTDPATNKIKEIIQEAARKKNGRSLIFLTGTPGSGKTYVGLRLTHDPSLDDIAAKDKDGKPKGAPAAYISGNGPLVEVLQHLFRKAGGGGKAFIKPERRNVREHVLIFDEAQRLFDKEKAHQDNMSEATALLRMAGKVEDWSVVIALIGEGQAINSGEEGGMQLWLEALAESQASGRWEIHGPGHLANSLPGHAVQDHAELHLDANLRTHLSACLHEYVASLLEPGKLDSRKSQSMATELREGGHRVLVTRDLELGKEYLCDRYRENPDARFGMIASRRAKNLKQLGVPNEYMDTTNMKLGPWFMDNEVAEGGLSCRHLDKCATEFDIQGLELDGVLLAWGTDFFLERGKWTNHLAMKHQIKPKDPLQLRINSYRVLLTRARDVTVVFMPEDTLLDETHQHLLECGFANLDEGI